MQEYKIVVAGCRDFYDYSRVEAELDAHLKWMENQKIIIISGGATGADALGERYAAEHNFPVERYPADWERYGRVAGPKRNMQMAKDADEVIVFWDGKSRGTKNMIECAKKANKLCKVVLF
ncbi:MAG: DUF2493 domain-containing protein [Clostridia bacterium]|nr:DUF2493 domain-containing protein [Clostridia bacterium]